MKHLKKQAMQGLATVSASVLVLSMGVETLANSRAQFINGRLGTTNCKERAGNTVKCRRFRIIKK